jgi:MYXO-CTERM domain-containing protein
MARRWLASLGLVIAVVSLSPSAARAAGNLTVDGAKTLQTMDGMGININVNSWNGGELEPALDLLVDVHGSSLVRVIRDPMDWVPSEASIAPLHALDETTLKQIYETPRMQDIWSTIAYLNKKGVGGRGVILNFMGWTPKWLGGSGAYGAPSHITPGKEGEWATMVASLVYYGRKKRNLDFLLLSPLNEQDWNCLEGPCLDSAQYRTALEKLVAELDSMGLSDIRLVGPDCAGSTAGYLPAMMASSPVAAKTDRFGLHLYGGAASPGTAYPGKSYWLTETAASCSNCDTAGTPAQGEWAFASQTNDQVLDDLDNGLTGVLLYDGYDSFYYHHDSLGFWGLLSYASKAYAPRKRFYANAQLAHFIRPGFVGIGTAATAPTLGTVVAFRGAAGEVTIAGHNKGGATTLDGTLLNLPAISALSLYATSASQDLARAPDVPVVGGTFTVQIPEDTFFTLTTVTSISSVGDAGASRDAGAGDGSSASNDPSSTSGDRDGGSAAGATGEESGGCGCRLTPRGTGREMAAPLALVALLASRRRRRRSALSP